jgi:hypothetical protein
MIELDRVVDKWGQRRCWHVEVSGGKGTNSRSCVGFWSKRSALRWGRKIARVYGVSAEVVESCSLREVEYAAY